MKITLVFLFLFSASSTLARQCPPGERRVRGHPRKGYVKSDGKQYSGTNVTSYCRTVSRSFKFWNEKFGEGFPPNWPHEREKQKPWTEEEKEKITDALEKNPEGLWQDTIKKIYRMARSVVGTSNPATSAKELIVVYDSAFNGHDLSQVLAHELAHEVFRNMEEIDQEEYAEQADWINQGKLRGKSDKWVTSRTKFVKPDGGDSPEEDFANNVEIYLSRPEKLKFFSPRAYEWIKERLGSKINSRKGNL